MVSCQGCHGHNDVIVAQDAILDRMAHGVLKVCLISVGRGKAIQCLVSWKRWQWVVCFINENRFKGQAPQLRNRRRHGYEASGAKIDARIVPSTDFAEIGKDSGKLFQQSESRHCNQDLMMVLGRSCAKSSKKTTWTTIRTLNLTTLAFRTINWHLNAKITFRQDFRASYVFLETSRNPAAVVWQLCLCGASCWAPLRRHWVPRRPGRHHCAHLGFKGINLGQSFPHILNINDHLKSNMPARE